MKSQDTIVKDLVLIGGGHSHVAVLKMFGMKPMPGVRITVIARDVHTPYSGMLPGYVAGHYDFDDVHIDLRPLSQFAGARLYHDEAIRIDHVNKKVICKNRPPVSYDLLSVNIGSTPRVTGAAELGTPVKPINRFVRRWERLSDRIMENPGPHKIAIVGAGAAGVEILLAIQFRLKNMLKDRGRDSEELEFHLVSKTETIMPQFPASVGQRFERVLKERGVIVHRGREAEQTSAGTLELVGGETLKLDEILWVTAAGAAPWLKESGLAVDEHGFVSVKDTLESTSHPGIFAVGDIADVVNHPRPKAGVFAVRQGKPLAKNLRRVLLGKSPV
ncbi:MAG: FAD-dependent oxidoreductase, partial [Rhodospirillales bacterium]|nr:FAD-dependent oxidoreductase [Rhodospirillales bacterium]